jgi:chromosome segregation ATPase
MICSMVKKGLLGAALTTGALYVAFGTSAPSYVRTAFHKARHSVKGSVPITFEIERARQQIADLEPAILDNREELARAEVDVEHLDREIADMRKNLARDQKDMHALRQSLATGDLKLAGHRSGVSYTAEDVKADLANRFDHYRRVKDLLTTKEETLKLRHQAVLAARKKLAGMDVEKRKLALQLDAIQAKLVAIETTQQKNEFNFDDSALAKAKQTVSDLERRLEVKARVAEMEGHFPGAPLPAVEPDRDVVKEFDAEFGQPAKPAAKDGETSL